MSVKSSKHHFMRSSHSKDATKKLQSTEQFLQNNTRPCYKKNQKQKWRKKVVHLNRLLNFQPERRTLCICKCHCHWLLILTRRHIYVVYPSFMDLDFDLECFGCWIILKIDWYPICSSGVGAFNNKIEFWMMNFKLCEYSKFCCNFLHSKYTPVLYLL